MSICYIIIDDNNELIKIPTAKFHKLLDSDTGVSFIEYASKTMKYVEVAVVNENRKPISISYVGCHFITFNSKGMLNIDKYNEKTVSALNLSTLWDDQNHHENIITSEESSFKSKKHKNEHSWILSEEINSLIYNKILIKKTILKLVM